MKGVAIQMDLIEVHHDMLRAWAEAGTIITKRYLEIIDEQLKVSIKKETEYEARH